MHSLKVAILWHLHQPSYWDPRVEKYRYPWVFLHAARHYHAMARRVEASPGARVAFNLTPVLLEQLEHYAGGPPFKDRILEAILKPAADLDDEEFGLIVDHVFRIPLHTMVHPFPRYRELHALLGGEITAAQKRRITPGDLRDLQTLYLLTWCGAPLRQVESFRELARKGKQFTEEDKRAVFESMLGAVRETIPLYRALQDRGQIEVTTTPYYHPILPLLIDCGSARESRPGADLGEVDFRHRGDAEWHVREAVRSHRERFQRDPVGMWPAEGSVSDEALRLICEHGARWAGTDEGILGRSLGTFGVAPERKHIPWRFDDTGLAIYFRDRELSDCIGFVYSGWEPGRAVEDLIGRLLSIRDQLQGSGGDHCVSIILDGENPWEFYPDAGEGFLAGLYERLSTTPGLEMVRFCDHRESIAGGPALRHVVPGSWIDANFDTWIGVPEKNLAWKILSAARRELELEAPRAELPREIYRSEGSDWFWWLGPGHDTPYESSYEQLFRLNLRIAFEKLGLEPPAILDLAVPHLPTPVFQPPLHLFTPKIDGQPGNYYDWIAAGTHRASEGSFHRSRRILDRVRFGFDLENLYVRVEGNLKPPAEAVEPITVHAEFNRPERMKLVCSGSPLRLIDEGGGERTIPGQAVMETILEMAIPFTALGAGSGELVEFALEVAAGGNILDRLPAAGYILIKRPFPDFGQENWSV